MVALNQQFDPNEIPDDERNFDPIPSGTYNMQVIDSKIEETKAGTGEMLVLTVQVIDGEYANRLIWDRLNIRNQSAEAQRIAQTSLKSLCNLIHLDIGQLKDTEQLHFKPFTARVGVRRDPNGVYGPQNTLHYAMPNKGPTRTAPGKAPVQAQKGKAAAPAKPWAHKTTQELDDEIPF